MKLNYLTVILIVFISNNVRAADNGIYPCNVETKALMTMTSSWEEIYEAAIALPPNCFDGYFAEGISDTLIRKMGKDWDGFMKMLSDNQFSRIDIFHRDGRHRQGHNHPTRPLR